MGYVARNKKISSYLEKSLASGRKETMQEEASQASGLSETKEDKTAIRRNYRGITEFLVYSGERCGPKGMIQRVG